MKIKFYILIAILITLPACSEDNSNDTITEPGANSTGNMYAEIEGESFEADDVKAYHRNNFIIIEGTETDGNRTKLIEILVRNLNEPRIYAIGEDGNGFIYNAKATYTEISANGDSLIYYGQYFENLSLLDVTDLNNQNISGTFAFRASDKNLIDETIIDILEGRFNITF